MVRELRNAIARKLAHIACCLRCYRDPFAALVNCLGFKLSDQDIRYSLRNGLKFDVNRGAVDVRTINHVVCQRLYEPNSIFKVSDGWNVLDLGAHKGVFSVQSGARGRSVRVIAVEPEPDNYRHIIRNAEINGLSNVEVHNRAVAVQPGDATLVLSDASWGHRLTESADETGSNVLNVETVSLDDLIQSFKGDVDLLKIDIEGAEFDVLYGLDQALWGRVRRIAMEYHADFGSSGDGRSGEDLAAYLEQNGFRCMFVEGAHDHLFAWRADDSKGTGVAATALQ